MTIRRQMGITILIMIFFAVIINSYISSKFVDNHFKGYIQKEYDKKVIKIKDYSIELLEKGTRNSTFSEIELKNLIDNPIVKISILDKNGKEIIIIQNNMLGMHGNMMGHMNKIERDIFELQSNGKKIGNLIISRNSSIQNTETVLLFKSAIKMGTIISGIIALLLATIITAFISNKMSRDLRRTAKFANNIEMNLEDLTHYSNIREIRTIQISLMNLSSKLKLQKNVRKEKADQLSHEARTPLTILRTNCESALDGVTEMDTSRLESCLNEINNLTRIVEDINSVVDYKDESIQLKLEKFDLVGELKKIIKGMRVQFERKRIELLMAGDEAIEIESDRALISQAIYNLLTNAYKFTSEGGKVEINAIKKEFVKISIHDNGIGIDLKDLEKIFEVYYRSSKTRNIPGEGIGLYIAKRNINALGGSITAINRDHGASFIINLPM